MSVNAAKKSEIGNEAEEDQTKANQEEPVETSPIEQRPQRKKIRPTADPTKNIKADDSISTSTADNEATATKNESPLMIEVGRITPHPLNDEIYGSDELDQDLVKSVRESGILIPLTVDAEYTIISGHQRHKAAKACGKTHVPVIVKSYENDAEKIKALLDNNIQRRKSNLTLGREAMWRLKIEEELALRRKQAGRKTEEVAGEDEKATNGSNGKARDKVGEQLGISGVTAEHLIQSIQGLDALVKAGRDQEADQLRNAIKKSVSKGRQEAIKLGVVQGTEKKKAASTASKDTRKNSKPTTAQAETPVQTKSTTQEPKKADAHDEPSPYKSQNGFPPIESHESAMQAMRLIVDFLDEGGADDLDEGVRDKWANRFESLQRALINQGILED